MLGARQTPVTSLDGPRDTDAIEPREISRPRAGKSHPHDTDSDSRKLDDQRR